MSRVVEPTKARERAWKKWVASRPENVRKVAERFEPWSLYRMKSTGHRVIIYGFSENNGGPVTMTIVVSGKFNLVAFERQVYGIDPDDLEPCDPPPPDEPVGVMMDDNERDDFIDEERRKLGHGPRKRGNA